MREEFLEELIEKPKNQYYYTSTSPDLIRTPSGLRLPVLIIYTEEEYSVTFPVIFGRSFRFMEI
jgi:hypothetical protein